MTHMEVVLKYRFDPRHFAFKRVGAHEIVYHQYAQQHFGCTDVYNKPLDWSYFVVGYASKCTGDTCWAEWGCWETNRGVKVPSLEHVLEEALKRYRFGYGYISVDHLIGATQLAR